METYTERDLSSADLREAYLREADLTGANLYKADLTGADLYKANLIGANLINVKGKNIITYSRGQHQLTYVDGDVRIGCQYHPLNYWITNGERIGKDAEYTVEQINHYMTFIRSLKKEV